MPGRGAVISNFSGGQMVDKPTAGITGRFRPGQDFDAGFRFDKRFNPGMNNDLAMRKLAAVTAPNTRVARQRLGAMDPRIATQNQRHGSRGATQRGGMVQQSLGADLSFGGPSRGGNVSQRGGTGFNLSGTGNPFFEKVFNQQMRENQRAEDLTRQYLDPALADARAVPDAFANDPLNQAARGAAADLIANPDTITDQQQQELINRSSNLINARADSERRALGGAAVAQGGDPTDTVSAGQFGEIEARREGQLGQMASELELQRARERRGNLERGIGIGSGLAGQQAGVSQTATGQVLAATPTFRPNDLSGALGALANIEASKNIGQGLAASGGSPGFGSGFSMQDIQSPQHQARMNAIRQNILSGIRGGGVRSGTEFRGPTFTDAMGVDENGNIIRGANGRPLNASQEGLNANMNPSFRQAQQQAQQRLNLVNEAKSFGIWNAAGMEDEELREQIERERVRREVAQQVNPQQFGPSFDPNINEQFTNPFGDQLA